MAGKSYLNHVMPAYTNAFVNSFGEIDPNHTWGMDEHVGVIEAFSAAGTRAGQVMTNRNQWTEYEGTTSVTLPTYNGITPKIQEPNYKNNILGHDIQIPGWPHLNGLYYKANDNVLGGALKDNQISSGMLPAGDVTPYEIQYVSNWFRTHKITNPEDYREDLHLSDFFIQNVSCDNDQFYYNDTSSPYKTGWEKTGNNGPNLVTLQDVQTAEANGKKAVDGGAYTTGLHESITFSLDQLGFLDMKGDWTHVNNFNSGNSNANPEDKESNPNRMIQYVKSSGTEDFRCHPSWGTDQSTQWIDSWVLVHLYWNETVKDTNSPYYGDGNTVIPRDGYYLAFDFHASKNNGQTVVNQDGYYSNWIIKITPGHFNPRGNSRRIFCEDLGGSFDFDFNDAVIDVAFEQSGSKYIPIISVQAAGGTMPIYVQQNNPKYELHRILGKKDSETEYKPINVGAAGGSHSVGIYRGEPVTTDQAQAIHIFVENTQNKDKVTYEIGGSSTTDTDGNTTSIDTDGNSTLNGTTQTMKTVAPSAFSAPTSVKWMNELQGITKAYTQFTAWVTSFTNNTNWYETIKAGAPLYTAPNEQPADSPTSAGGTDTQVEWEALTPDAATASLNLAKLAKADSYLRVEGYGDTNRPHGESAIFGHLDELGDNGLMTCVVVLSSSTLYNQNTYSQTGNQVTVTPGIPLQGIIVPADIDNNGNMTYKGTSFTTSSLTRFVNATYAPESTEFSGEKTYTVEFTFRKSDILKQPKDPGVQDSKDVYHDYLLLFLKIGKDITPTYWPLTDDATYSGSPLTSAIHGVTIHKWYVHY